MPDNSDEYSIYEGMNYERESIENAIAFGRITNVSPEKRTCEVKTFFGNGMADDNHIPNCQWINLDQNPDGDESGTIPRINSYGLVFYINGEPFIFGMFSPLTNTGSASVGEDKEPLNEGDRVIKTVGNNKIIMRSHGEIQIESTKTCRTIYFPDLNLMNTLCRNYEFRTDGGTVDWKNDGDGNTLYRREIRDSFDRQNLIIEERGSVDGEIISRTEIGSSGPAGAFQSVWTKTIKNTGETELFIRAAGAQSGHKTTILPNGETKINVADKTTAMIKPTGETTLSVGEGKAVLTIKPSGETTYETEGKISASAKKAVEITTEAELNATAKGDASIATDGNVSIECAKAEISAQENQLPGGVVTDNAANNDPITGIPLTGVGGIDAK